MPTNLEGAGNLVGYGLSPCLVVMNTVVTAVKERKGDEATMVMTVFNAAFPHALSG